MYGLYQFTKPSAEIHFFLTKFFSEFYQKSIVCIIYKKNPKLLLGNVKWIKQLNLYDCWNYVSMFLETSVNGLQGIQLWAVQLKIFSDGTFSIIPRMVSSHWLLIGYFFIYTATFTVHKFKYNSTCVLIANQPNAAGFKIIFFQFFQKLFHLSSHKDAT